MNGRRFVMCGTPKEFCNGGNTDVNTGNLTERINGSSPEAFRCYKRYLLNQLGYEQVGAREFRAPDGSGILVLSKKTHFGGIFRQGKTEKTKAKRANPYSGRAGLIF